MKPGVWLPGRATSLSPPPPGPCPRPQWSFLKKVNSLCSLPPFLLSLSRSSHCLRLTLLLSDALLKLAEQETPLYVYSEAQIERQIAALKGIQAASRVFYAIKANPNADVLKVSYSSSYSYLSLCCLSLSPLAHCTFPPAHLLHLSSSPPPLLILS